MNSSLDARPTCLEVPTSPYSFLDELEARQYEDSRIKDKFGDFSNKPAPSLLKKALRYSSDALG